MAAQDAPLYLPQLELFVSCTYSSSVQLELPAIVTCNSSLMLKLLVVYHLQLKVNARAACCCHLQLELPTFIPQSSSIKLELFWSRHWFCHVRSISVIDHFLPSFADPAQCVSSQAPPKGAWMCKLLRHVDA
ncbi:hypothetical protein Pfo_018881 [Paulownia fortunei]|nr:hypothetical protein Pfo_018881 [Paulownia fortunei]